MDVRRIVMVAIQNGVASGVGNPSPDRLEVFGVNEVGGVRWRMAWAVDELWVDGGVLVGAGPEAVRALGVRWVMSGDVQVTLDDWGVMVRARDVVPDPDELLALEELFVLTAAAAGVEP